MRIMVALGTNANDERKSALHATYKRMPVVSTFVRHMFVIGPQLMRVVSQQGCSVRADSVWTDLSTLEQA